MRFRFIAALLLTPALPGLGAGEAFNSPIPLVRNAAAAGPSAAESILTLEAARRAQDLGFPSVAAGLYRQLLAARFGDPGPQTLALATALLDDGQADEAARVLAGFPGPRGSAWHLRMALAATEQSRPDVIRGEMAAIRPDELTAADRPWYFFLQGLLAGAAGDAARANEFYDRAKRAAPTALARTYFLIRDEQNRLQFGRGVTAAQTDQVRIRAEQLQGTAAGYESWRNYAVMLNALGRRGDAIPVLQRQLQNLPAEEREQAEDFRLLLGLIAGAADDRGRAALTQLLETGTIDHQRMALQLLAQASPGGPDRAAFRAELDRLAALPAYRPILDYLLLFRAEFALGDKAYAEAEKDARALLENFPASPLRVYAWGILARSPWEQLRFRTAAAAAQKARDELPPGETRAMLAVLVAEASFRAGDFPGAAEAYAAAAAEHPAGVAPGRLMFQRVEAEIEGGALDDAEKTIGALADDPAFDAVDRWEAEWNLARALQLAGRAEDAYRRINQLLLDGKKAPAAAGGPAGLSAELRVRMAWLQARLSFDVREYDQTLRFASSLTGSLDGLPQPLRTDIASTGALLTAQADFALSRDATAQDLLQRLRLDFPSSDAAVYSYIIEADHDAQQDRIAEALQLLNKLADSSPANAYAPYALYQAALLAERLGQEKNFSEANEYIERLVTLVKKYPASDPANDLVFYARLKQGDLMREMNNYPQAEVDYEFLRDNFPQHQDAVLAQLALADCYNAQWANDPSHAERAVDLFAHLRDREDAPADVRVEAGYKLGDLDQRRGSFDEAEEVWWRDVAAAFLLNPARAAQLGAKGRYWMSRTLVEFGDLERRRGKLEEAKQAWQLVVAKQLPYAEVARQRLEPFHLAAAKP